MWDFMCFLLGFGARAGQEGQAAGISLRYFVPRKTCRSAVSARMLLAR
jgi:hypothetical protein